MRWFANALFGLALAMGCTQGSPTPPPPPITSPPVPVVIRADAAIAPDAAIAVDAKCETASMPSHRADYPAPTLAELKLASSRLGWFFQPDRTVMIHSACDLGDRIVMVDDHEPASSLWIWSRHDESALMFSVDEESGHMGHNTVISKSAPSDSRVFDVITEGPDLLIDGGVGRTYGTRGGCWIAGPRTSVETVIACSTAKLTILVDALEPPSCSTFPDGIGWPLALSIADRSDEKRAHSTRTRGQLVKISPDRTAWTYRFGRTDFVLHLGAHPWAALGDDRCAVLLVDNRRTHE